MYRQGGHLSPYAQPCKLLRLCCGRSTSRAATSLNSLESSSLLTLQSVLRIEVSGFMLHSA